jgi:hypothetical protein
MASTPSNEERAAPQHRRHFLADDVPDLHVIGGGGRKVGLLRGVIHPEQVATRHGSEKIAPSHGVVEVGQLEEWAV